VFLGHYAAALGAKKLAPYSSLGTFILACELSDLLWPTFLLQGVEQVRIVPDNPPLLRLDFAWSAQSLWIFVVWGYWLDRHRVAARQW
jgi:hypothetical protein